MAGISRVVLYKHGVGFFERVEEVQGNQEIRLTFRSSEMNDVLKSLTLFDLDGGSVSSVSYDTQKPVEMLLDEVALNLPAGGGQAALLGAIRGARVKVAAGSRELTGRIVGVEESQQRSADGIVRSCVLSLLDDKGTMHSADLKEVSGLTFLDEHIKKDLAFYFETLIASTKRDSKSLSIHARGKGKRKVQMSYVIECPVWKTSYRVSLPEGDEKPFLQGWALVDNTQDEDWEDVRLSLVAGLPISFVHDLYTPRYIRRREVQVEREAAAGPVMAEAAFAGGFLEELDEGGGGDLFGAAPPPPPAAPERAAAWGTAVLSKIERRVQAKDMAASTVTQSLGDLFEYAIDHPVTVHRNQSALVPIVASESEGRRIVLYNPEQREQNPFAALELTNSTGLTLEGGPLVVYEGDTYAGEAMLDTFKPGDTRIVPFAVDLGVLVDSLSEQRDEDVSMVVANQGRLYLHSGRVYQRTYKLNNKDDRAKTCILEHRKSSNCELLNTQAPREETASFYRFELTLDPGKTTTLKVQERQRRADTVILATMNPEQLAVYVSKGYFSDSQRQALEEVAQLVESLTRLRGKLTETVNRSATISKDQARLRENLKSLGNSADEGRLRSRYVTSLEEQETTLEKLDQLAQRLQEELVKRQEELDAAARAISFEHVLGGQPVPA